jgi:hypothetical protein
MRKRKQTGYRVDFNTSDDTYALIQLIGKREYPLYFGLTEKELREVLEDLHTPISSTDNFAGYFKRYTESKQQSK